MDGQWPDYMGPDYPFGGDPSLPKEAPLPVPDTPTTIKNYAGTSPLCTRCNYHHVGNCRFCDKCKGKGHTAHFCRKIPATNPATPATGANRTPTSGGTRVCYKCNQPGHFKKDCPKLKQRGGPGRVRTSEDLQREDTTATRLVRRRVEGLEEEEKEDSAAIQTLYHRIGADHTRSNTQGVQIRALEYRAQIAESRLAAAEHELRRLREQFDAMEKYMDDMA